MNDPFIPLTRSTAAAESTAASFRLKVIPGSESAQPFKPILQALPHSHAHGTGASLPQPRVTFKRDGDRVTHICIQCACGQELELACVY